MDRYAESRGWKRIIPESHPNANGIDAIYKTPEGDIVFVEAKEFAGKGNYMRKLSKGASYGDQMSDQWLKEHIERLQKNGVVLGKGPDGKPVTYGELLNSLDNPNTKKQVVVYKTTGFNGRTITEGFADDLTKIEGKNKINDVVIIGSAG